MAERKATFYEQAFILLDGMDEEAVAQGIKAAAAYFLRGEAASPSISSGGRVVFEQMKYYIDYSAKKASEGRKGGRPKKVDTHADDFDELQDDTISNELPVQGYAPQPFTPIPLDREANQEAEFEQKRQRAIDLLASNGC
ncbi:MAG: hypothetical protein IIY61_09950 [Ruminococcus sp.]|nr:hypothetical protein [Ruminococcus sp.]